MSLTIDKPPYRCYDLQHNLIHLSSERIGHMFDDIVILASYSTRLITACFSHSRGWRDVYFVYCALDQCLPTLKQLLKQVDLLPLTTTRLTPAKTKIYGSAWNMRVDRVNQLFDAMRASIITIIDHLANLGPYLTIDDQRLQFQYTLLFGPKGILLNRFQDVYRAGELHNDDYALYRTGSVLVKRITESEHWPLEVLARIERTGLASEDELHERIALDTEEKRNRLVAEGQKQIAELEQVQQALAGFIRQHCTLADLL